MSCEAISQSARTIPNIVGLPLTAKESKVKRSLLVPCVFFVVIATGETAAMNKHMLNRERLVLTIHVLI